MSATETITVKHTGQQGSHLRGAISRAGLEGEVNYTRFQTTMTVRQACDLLAAFEAHASPEDHWSPAYRNVVKKVGEAVAAA